MELYHSYLESNSKKLKLKASSSPSKADPHLKGREECPKAEGESAAKKTNETKETRPGPRSSFHQAETEQTEGWGTQELRKSAQDGKLCPG